MDRSLIVQIAASSLIFLFTYAGITKLMDYQKFVIQIAQSPLLTAMAGFIAWFIPVLEIAIVFLLTFEQTRLLGLYVSFALLTSFTIYIVMITQYSHFIPCSCGGVLENLSWDEHLFFNIGFVILTIIGVVFYPLPENATFKTPQK